MKSSLYQLSVLAVITGALALAPVQSFAQEKKNETAPEKKSEHTGDAKKAPNPNKPLPFHGKLDAVDKQAKTLKVGERVFHITSETRIKKDEKPATLDDGVVGEPVRGSYHQTENGKLNAVSVSFGQKPAEGEKPAANTSVVPQEKPIKKQPKSAQKVDQKAPE